MLINLCLKDISSFLIYWTNKTTIPLNCELETLIILFALIFSLYALSLSDFSFPRRLDDLHCNSPALPSYTYDHHVFVTFRSSPNRATLKSLLNLGKVWTLIFFSQFWVYLSARFQKWKQFRQASTLSMLWCLCMCVCVRY